MTRPITAIYGVEPMREGEYPAVHVVGGKSTLLAGQGDARRFTVTQIERREEPHGDHTLSWYDVYAGDAVAVSLQARAVAEIHYAPEVTA